MSPDLVPVDELAAVPKYADIVPTAEQLQEKREQFPDDTESKIVWRTKMSILAKARHEHERNPDGSPRFGGVQKGSGRPSKRLGEAFKEWSDENDKRILDALSAGIASSEAPKDRHKAAANILKLRQAEDKIEMKERKFDGMSKDDLETAFVKAFIQKARDGDPIVGKIIQGLMEAKASEGIAGEEVHDDE